VAVEAELSGETVDDLENDGLEKEILEEGWDRFVALTFAMADECATGITWMWPDNLTGGSSETANAGLGSLAVWGGTSCPSTGEPWATFGPELAACGCPAFPAGPKSDAVAELS